MCAGYHWKTDPKGHQAWNTMSQSPFQGKRAGLLSLALLHCCTFSGHTHFLLTPTFSRRHVGRRCEGTLCKVTPQSASGWVGAEGRRDSNPAFRGHS